MADKHEMEGLLRQLAERTEGAAPDGLDGRIKERIPRNLHPHRGLDTVNIIIDLRISRVAAAIIIVASLVLFAKVFHAMNESDTGVYEDLKTVVARLPGTGASKGEVLDSAKGVFEKLRDGGKEVMYLGDSCNLDDRNAVLLYWKLEDGKYAVVFSDMRLRTVSSDMLIRLQSAMIEVAGR